jgi:hypothetical protein
MFAAILLTCAVYGANEGCDIWVQSMPYSETMAKCEEHAHEMSTLGTAEVKKNDPTLVLTEVGSGCYHTLSDATEVANAMVDILKKQNRDPRIRSIQ